MTKRSIVSFNLRLDLLDKLDKYARELGISRNKALEQILEIFFHSFTKDDKPKTIKESVIRWLLTGEWITPIELEER